MPSSPAEFRKEIEEAINRCSMENASNTPDFVLAKFLCACLEAFDAGARERETWYGRSDRPGSARPPLISDEERARRQPLPPGVLLDAQRSSSVATGRLIAATPVVTATPEQPGPNDDDCYDCDDGDFSCEVCGANFCSPHTEEHAREGCHAAPAVPLREGTPPVEGPSEHVMLQGPTLLAACGHTAYRDHRDMCIQDGCAHAAYQVCDPLIRDAARDMVADMYDGEDE